ncbi:MAG: 23S rRNA (uracil(1939)-C(5))-methyltransferase RlmD [Bacteroidetes bacterium]|nr:23S rRNA (uracil(1939)-C(5))-methyltransferase RlmD [Bacteroidota bacterium]
MNKGDTLELTISSYASEGKGIAKVYRSKIKPQQKTEVQNVEEENYVVFVQGSYPGDKVTAQLRRIKNSYAEAKAIEIISPSKHRVEPRCKFFGTCGGCRQQDLNYETQLKYKEELVKETFEHIGGLTDYKFENIVPSEKVFFYRNKMEFSFSDKRWLTKDEIGADEIIDKDFALGLHIPRIFDKVLDIDECFLQSELSNKILNFTRKFFKEKSTTIYSTKTHKGYLRNLVIRQSQNTDDLMVNLVTSSEDDELMNEYTTELLKAVPQITTIINNINLKKASVAIGDYEKVYYGSGYIYDMIGDYKFRISSNSFFQTNTLQAENLYKTALDFAELKGDEIIYDLYSGAGTIAIYVSDEAGKIYGFESIKSALKDAEKNAMINSVDNVEFIEANLYKTFLPIVEKKKIPKPDAMIIDPPRSGMHKNTIDDVIQLDPGKIVYVSCNPATQARDIKMMVEAGYKLKKMKPVDMFPHTYHIENVAFLSNGKKE